MTPDAKELSTEEIERLRELCEAATPGPWNIEALYSGLRHLVKYYEGYVVDGSTPSHDDSAFIAYARDALPRCLDEIERLKREAALVELTRETEKMHGYCEADECELVALREETSRLTAWLEECTDKLERQAPVVAAAREWRADDDHWNQNELIIAVDALDAVESGKDKP